MKNARSLSIAAIMLIIVCGGVYAFIRSGKTGRAVDRLGGSQQMSIPMATASGIPVTLLITACGKIDSRACFGAEAANPASQGPVLVEDLTSTSCSINYGLTINQDQAYVVSIDFGNKCSQVNSAEYKKAHDQFHGQILTDGFGLAMRFDAEMSSTTSAKN